MLPILGYLLPSLTLGSLQPLFLQIHFQFLFLFLLLLAPLLNIGWHTLYYSIDFVCCFHFPICLSVCCSDWVISSILFSIAGLPWCSAVKNLPANSEDASSSPRPGRSPGEGKGNSLQYSCLGNSMDRGACQATVHGVARVRQDLATKQQQQSSMTLIHSSSLFSVLFIAFRSVFISAIELSNFDWFIFIVSSPLLQCSAFLSIGSSSSAFSFYLNFSVFMNLGKTIIYYGFEGLFLCMSIPV